MDIDLNKIRRFSLLIGLILLSYSWAGVELDTPARISPLGIPLKIKHPDLIGIGLLIASFYSTLRYWYYAVLTGTTPKMARQRLQDGFLPDGSRGSTEPSKSVNYKDIDTYTFIVEKEVEKYFPVFPKQEKTKFEVKSKGKHFEINILPNKSIKILGFLHDFDYFSPIILNTIAIFSFIIKLFL